MLVDTDSLALAPGVALDRGRLADQVRGAAWPLNASGAFVLCRAGVPVGQVVREIADAFSLPPEAARGDLLRFAWRLNALALVNIERGETRRARLVEWLVLAARLAPAGALPAPIARRRALDTRSVPRAVASSLGATAARAVVLAATATLVALQVAVLAGVLALDGSLALGLGAGLGLGLHEAGHAAALRGVPSALVTRGCRTYVLHARVDATRRSAVAVRAMRRRRPRRRRHSRGSGAHGACTRARRLSARRTRVRSHGRRRRRTDRMRALKAFVLGAISVGILAYALVAALAVAAQAGGRTLDIALGPLTLVSVVDEGRATETTFGIGLLVLAFVGGLANLAAAHLMRHRSRRADDRVD